MFRQIIDIFTDPFFILMAAILAGVFYFVYTTFGLRNEGVSEEEEQLINQLERYGLTYLSSKVEKDKGPFEEVIIEPVSVFDKVPPKYLSYRTVQAQQADGEQLEFWVKFDYQKARIAVISWMPDITKYGREPV